MSLGDITTISTIAVQIFKALNNTDGAPKDYQDLIDELSAFRHALTVLEQKIRANSSDEDLVQRVIAEVATCHTFMADFLNSIKSYQVLGQKSQNPLWPKVVWNIFKVKEVGHLRQKLSSRRGILMLYLTIGTMDRVETVSKEVLAVQTKSKM